MASRLKLEVLLQAVDRATAPFQRVSKQSARASRALRATQEQFKALDRQQKDVRGYRTTNIEIAKQTRALRDLEHKSLDYTRRLDQQRAAHTNIKANLTAARTQYNRLAKALMDGKGNSEQFRRELDKAKITLHANQQAFDRSSKSIRTYRSRARNADTQIAQLTQRQRQSQERLADYKRRLDAAGISTDGLGRSARQMRGEQQRLNNVLEEQKKKLDAINKRQERSARMAARANAVQRAGMVTAGHGAGLTFAGQRGLRSMSNLIAPGVSFGVGMSRVQALTRLDKDDPRLAALKKQARELGASTSFSATEAADAMGFLGMAGFNPDAIMAAMPGMLDLALANQTDLAQTADISSNILSGFGLDPKEMARVGDVLTATTTRSNVNLSQLGDTMKYVAPVARELGVSLEESAAMSGMLGDVGIQGSQAGTSMRAIVSRLAAPVGKAAAAMDKLKVSSRDAQGNMRNVPAIIADIARATENMGSSERFEYLQEIFGREPAAAIAELINKQGSGGIEKFVEILKHSAGENARAARVMGDNIDGDLKSLRSAWEEIGIAIQDVIDGPLRGFIQRVTDVTRRIGEWINLNPELAAQIAKFVAIGMAIVTALGAVLVVLGSLLMLAKPLFLLFKILSVTFGFFGKTILWAAKTAAPVMLKALSALGTAALSLGKVLLSTLISAVKAVGIALYALAKSAVVAALKALAALGTAALSLGKVLLGALISAIKAVGIALYGLATNPVVLAIAAMIALIAGGAYLIWKNWDWLGPKFTALWEGITSVASGVWSSFMGTLGGWWAEIKNDFNEGVLIGILNLIADWNPIGMFYRGFAAVLDLFGVELPSRFSEFGRMMLTGLVDGIKSMAGMAKDAISGVADGVTGWFKEKLGIRSPSRVFAAAGRDTMDGYQLGLAQAEQGPLKQVDTFSKRMRQAGAGIALGAAALPAAAGVQFDARPPIASAGAAGAAMHNEFNINVQAAPGMDEQALARYVAQEVQRALAQAQRDAAARRRSALYDTE